MEAAGQHLERQCMPRTSVDITGPELVLMLPFQLDAIMALVLWLAQQLPVCTRNGWHQHLFTHPALGQSRFPPIRLQPPANTSACTIRSTLKAGLTLTSGDQRIPLRSLAMARPCNGELAGCAQPPSHIQLRSIMMCDCRLQSVRKVSVASLASKGSTCARCSAHVLTCPTTPCKACQMQCVSDAGLCSRSCI